MPDWISGRSKSNQTSSQRIGSSCLWLQTRRPLPGRNSLDHARPELAKVGHLDIFLGETGRRMRRPEEGDGSVCLDDCKYVLRLLMWE